MGAMQSRCPSSGGRGVEDAAPYGGCETKAAACGVTGVVPDAYQWCAGCAREIGCVGLWARGWRAVINVGKIGRAERLRLTRLGNLATTVHRGRRTLQAAAKPALRHMAQREW